jgi:hypothetical protein
VADVHLEPRAQSSGPGPGLSLRERRGTCGGSFLCSQVWEQRAYRYTPFYAARQHAAFAIHDEILGINRVCIDFAFPAFTSQLCDKLQQLVIRMHVQRYQLHESPRSLLFAFF